MKQFLTTAVVALSVFATSSANAADHGHAKSDLDSILAAQSDEHKARYAARNPKETLEFFEVSAGDTVLEALPGGGWYTRILLPLLGEEGQLIGVGYPPLMGQDPENPRPKVIEHREAWPTTWPASVAEWGLENAATVSAYNFGAIPDSLNGTVDKVLFFRALHGLAGYGAESGYLSSALADSFRVLKAGGILGVVQHEAREDRSDEWASGKAGYLKRSFVVDAAEQAGFELIDSSDINANDLDQADEGDIVWRLPPALNGTQDDPELAAKMNAIGESNRMTLKFKKPE